MGPGEEREAGDASREEARRRGSSARPAMSNLASALWALLRSRPALILEAARAGWAFRSRRGVLPARDLVRWRLATAYGSAQAPIEPEDLVSFLEWRRTLRSAIR